MKKIVLFLTILSLNSIAAQIQISNFTFNNIPSSSPAYLQEFDGKLFFSAATDDYGKELWTSDGTSESTVMVKDIAPGTDNGLVTFPSAILNNELYFVANNDFDYSGGEIWKTDGTEAGSALVISYSGRMCYLTTVGDQIFFTIKTEDYIMQIWKTDGTASGTVLVKDNIGIWNAPTFQGSVNGKFIITIQVPSSNTSKVWCSDGTEAGTYPLTAALDGNGSGLGGTAEFSQYIMYNEDLYFVTRSHLYKTDGTIAGTNQVATVWNAYTDLVEFSDAIEVNGKMYFSFFSDDTKKLSIYESNGTSSGTSLVYTVTGSEYFYPSRLNKVGNNLIFSSINATNGTSLFYLNTDTEVVSEVIEIEENPQEPEIFWGSYTVLSLDQLDENIFFMSTPTVDVIPNNGWIVDLNALTLTSIDELDNLTPHFGQKIVYNNDLYYSKNNQLYKFDSSTLSTEKMESHKNIQVYPNPTSEYISFTDPEGITDIKIYDLNGRLVLEESMLKNNKINVADLNSGMYVLNFKKDNVVVSKKVVVSN